MNEIKVLNDKFEAARKFTVDSGELFSKDSINVAAVHQVVLGLLSGRRQGNACTKTKALVSGGGKKPFKQKGTGRARQGSSRSPLMPGGGTVFGPLPRSHKRKLNKKLVNVAIKSLLADKAQNGKLVVLDKMPKYSKTSEWFRFLKNGGLNCSLIVYCGENVGALRGTRNLEKAKSLPVDGFSVYECLKFENLIIEESALKQLVDRIKN